jgi:hypothetical protein
MGSFLCHSLTELSFLSILAIFKPIEFLICQFHSTAEEIGSFVAKTFGYVVSSIFGATMKFGI